MQKRGGATLHLAGKVRRDSFLLWLQYGLDLDDFIKAGLGCGLVCNGSVFDDCHVRFESLLGVYSI